MVFLDLIVMHADCSRDLGIFAVQGWYLWILKPNIWAYMKVINFFLTEYLIFNRILSIFAVPKF